MKLFCLPCAGASASQYFKWKQYLIDELEVIPIDYPGHGTLCDQELVITMDELVQSVLKQIKDQASKEPFSLLGHSMGACVAYEIAKIYKKNNDDNLQSVFICGSSAPNFYLTEYKYLKILNDEQFMEEIISMGGIPKELLENEMMLNYYFPIIKNDFYILENYFPELVKLEVPLIVLGGKKDRIVKENYKYWRIFSKASFIHELEGDHFFVNDVKPVMKIIHDYFCEGGTKNQRKDMVIV